MDVASLTAFFDAQPGGHGDESISDGVAFTYGELTIDGVVALLRDADERRRRFPGQRMRYFVDLGSGTGKIVLCAAVLFPFLTRCIGVELSERRHRLALKAQAELQELIPDARLGERVAFLCEDARCAVAPVAAADVLWISNTCFPPELNASISATINDFAPAAGLVYSTHSLNIDRVAHFARCSDEEGQHCGVDESAISLRYLSVTKGGNLDSVHLPSSWSASHEAAVAVLRDPPAFRAGTMPGDADSLASRSRSSSNSSCRSRSDIRCCSQPLLRAFNRWSSVGQQQVDVGRQTARQHTIDEDFRVLRGTAFSRAAIASAFLAQEDGVSAIRLLDELYGEGGVLRDICVELPDSLDLAAFEEVHGQCLDALHVVTARRCGLGSSKPRCGANWLPLCGF
eukprot:TRINITY_DN37705_c0_g1_i1.p1 TRINITY_DN37705_c0_g1~~TRINITY_DN37705_c0_g1_i1.p1  ORF type:complete len:400 (-),score=69.06 TRINITY_DN37705_c0_g1_i1:150-1349(-)